jgi:hypothetical protein
LEIWQNYVNIFEERRDKQRMEAVGAIEWIIKKQLFFSA